MSLVELAACLSHQAATNVVKYLIQEHNNMSKVVVEPRFSIHCGRHENGAPDRFGHAAGVSRNDFKIIQFFWFVHYLSTVRVKTIVKLNKGKYKPIKPIG